MLMIIPTETSANTQISLNAQMNKYINKYTNASEDIDRIKKIQLMWDEGIIENDKITAGWDSKIPDDKSRL